jgi:enoyl-CoA hydratase/carnithine racemase
VPDPDLEQRALELAVAIASQPPAAVQGTVKAIWQAMDRSRDQALSTALLYTQVGNPIGTADFDRSAAKPARWRLR